MAATLHGSPVRTGDADICPARDSGNLTHLATALEDLDARIFAPDAPDGVAFARDATFLSGVELVNLITRFGPLDVSFKPSGFTGYEELLSALSP